MDFKIIREILKISLFLFMFPITYIIFNLLIDKLGLKLGYWIAFMVYWLIIVSFTFYYSGFKGVIVFYKIDNSKKQWWSLLAFMPVVGVLFISFIPSFPKLKLSLMILTIVTGLVNGTCEELFWRGLTLKSKFKSVSVVIITSLIGFSIWHFTLCMIAGLKYQGGILALVGGAVAMGLIWQLVATKTNSILFVTIAHILTNIFAFSTLILDNW